MDAFLNSLATKNTRRLYKRGIDRFVDFYGKSIDEILTERKADLTPRSKENMIDAKQRSDRYEKLLEQFYFWLEQEGYEKANTRYSYCKGVLQLFRYYSMSLTLRNGSPINQTNPKIDDFPLKPEHVKKMFHIAKDLRSKLLVSMGNDLGWRISDVLSIERAELPNLDQEPPIEWLRITAKEKEVSKACLSKTTVILLKQYMFTFPSGKNPFLFFNNGGTIDDYVVNRRLKDLAEEAKIELGNLSLSWHCFRKMIISSAKNLSIDPDIIKLMTGKSVEKSMLPYLNGIDVRSSFIRLQTVLGITALTESDEDSTKALKEDIKRFKDALVASEDRFTNIETANKALKERIDFLNQKWEHFKKVVGNISLLAETETGRKKLHRVLEEELLERDVETRVEQDKQEQEEKSQFR
jgi:hypothetical protein